MVATARRTRLSPEREAELYAAVLDELRDVGYDVMTMDAVAARSRSSKATLYRQWGNKPRLVAAAVRHHKPVLIDESVDTGSLRGDLYEFAYRCGCADTQKDTELAQALGVAARKNPDLADALHEAVIRPELDLMKGIIDRAVARGEIPSDGPANSLLPHMLSGAAFARPLIDRLDADEQYLRRYVDAVVIPALLRH